MSRGRNALPVIGAVAVVITIVGGIIAAMVIDNRQRDAQQKDFRQDLVAMQFNNPQPRWENETKTKKGKTTTESALEAVVTVEGCQVELERAKDQEAIGTRVNGRAVELYQLDEAMVNGREVEIDDATVTPNADAVENYLRQHAEKFRDCLTTKAS